MAYLGETLVSPDFGIGMVEGVLQSGALLVRACDGVLWLVGKEVPSNVELPEWVGRKRGRSTVVRAVRYSPIDHGG